jgi:hypothetical protein
MEENTINDNIKANSCTIDVYESIPPNYDLINHVYRGNGISCGERGQQGNPSLRIPEKYWNLLR